MTGRRALQTAPQDLGRKLYRFNWKPHPDFCIEFRKLSEGASERRCYSDVASARKWMPRSSSGLGRWPFTPVTRVQIPYGVLRLQSRVVSTTRDCRVRVLSSAWSGHVYSCTRLLRMPQRSDWSQLSLLAKRIARHLWRCPSRACICDPRYFETGRQVADYGAPVIPTSSAR